jgi:hypothetical protein
MTNQSPHPFSPTETLRHGWRAALEHRKILLPISGLGAILALIQNALSHAKGGAALAGILVQVMQMAVTLALVRTALRLHDGKPPGDWRLDVLLAGFWPYLLTHVLYGLIVAAGMVLLIVPGVLWAIRFAFAGFAVVDGQGDPIQALRESTRLTTGHRWPLFQLGLLLLAVNLLGAIAFGVGLMITIPTSCLAAAEAFRRLQAHALHVPAPGERPLPSSAQDVPA